MPSGLRISEESAPSQDGDVALCIFTPEAPVKGMPVMLFIHGGGWSVGGPRSLDYLCSNLCVQAGVTVISVDYRLAPECPFPAGLNDCFDALVWTRANAARLAPGSSGIAVIGDSAGGNLSAALCLLTQERAGPHIIHQTLIYPSLDATLQSPSMSLVMGGLTSKDLALALDAYRGKEPAENPLISPMLSNHLASLPPALILTGGGDLLRDDGRRYAVKLVQAGVPARLLDYPDMPHGFFSLPKLCSEAPQALAEVIKEIQGLRAGNESALGR
jgi:acetyl esterase